MAAVVDRRQMIIDRLGVILGGLTITLTSGVIASGNFVHNRNDLPTEMLPGIILLDGDEKKAVLPADRPQGRPSNRARDQVMTMQPEIYVVLDFRKPNNVLSGEDVNTARLAILAAIMTDATLFALLGAEGGFAYLGCVTDFAANRTMNGALGISLALSYPLVVAEIRGT